MRLEYRAEVQGGKVVMPTKRREQMAADIAKAFEGKAITITVEKRKKGRSPEQNRYYWGVVVQVIATMLKDYDPTTVVTPELCHEYLKKRFLPMVQEWQEVIVKTPDDRQEIIFTTTVLSTTQFMDYLELIAEWAASLGWVVPSPDEFCFEGETVDVDKH